LQRIAFLLERKGEPSYRVQAFRRAASTIAAFEAGELAELIESGRLRELRGIGESTARVVTEAAAGEIPAYLRGLETEVGGGEEADERGLSPGGAALRDALRGDCHSHSDWSDGGATIREMAETARALGHEWWALTDHSPSLKIANGLSTERLREQLEVVAALNEELAPFRILTGIEVDIREDGSLDQDDDVLAQLDVVVASVHSKLRMEERAMTPRMVAAVRHPHVDVLGHCTGRLVTGRGRPPSTFDAEAVFTACREAGTAVEVNSRPERLDPPMALLQQAVELGCDFTISTDAHAPGQLDWQPYGCERAAAAGVPPERVVNTRPLEDVLKCE